MSTGIGVGVSSAFGGVKASPSFEYSASAFCADAYPDPVPTINGTPGGTFSAAPVAPSTGTLVINSSTGRVTLASSDPGNYLVTYTIGGVSESDPFEVLAVQTTGFSYSSNSFSDSGTASPTITGSAGGVFTATTGLSIDANTGVIDLGASTVGGPYTVTYTNTGACQGTPSTFDITITATVRIIANNFAMEFDGQNYINVVDDGLGLTSAITISAWFKQAVGGGTLQQLIAEDTTGGTTRNWGIIIVSKKPNFQIWNASGGIAQPVAPTALTEGTWHHIVCTADGTTSANGVKMYINGSQVAQATAAATGIRNSSVPLRIGTTSGTPSYHFDGDIDEVAIWNKALALEDVQTIYNATNNNPGKCANLFTGGLKDGLQYWNRMGDN